jgi:hypothetical protein
MENVLRELADHCSLIAFFRTNISVPASLLDHPLDHHDRPGKNIEFIFSRFGTPLPSPGIITLSCGLAIQESRKKQVLPP